MMEPMDIIPEPRASLPKKIYALASRMSRHHDDGGLGTGEMAELRRWRYGGEIHPTAWRLLASCVTQEEDLSREMEDRWLAVMAGMALMAPDPHQSEEAPGKVLAQSGYSENRFHKLLNSQGDAFYDAIERTCRFLRAKGKAMDWVSMAFFILTLDPDKAEGQRRKMAKDYFSNQQQ